jgi:hypothetical protein
MVKRSGKGTTVERLEITQRRENSRAGNYVSGPEIPPQGRNFRPWTKFPGGQKFMEFPVLRNLTKSLTEHCGATYSKGAGNFIISGPRKFG